MGRPRTDRSPRAETGPHGALPRRGGPGPRATIVLAAAAATALAGCASWARDRTVPEVDLGFAIGARVGGDADARSVRVEAGAGAARWWSRGEGAALRHAALGAAALATLDEAGASLGALALVAPPRRGRDAGLQLRAGPRVGLGERRVAGALGVEWAHRLIGAVYVEASHDLVAGETRLLVGARVNVLFPYTLVHARAVPID